MSAADAFRNAVPLVSVVGSFLVVLGICVAVRVARMHVKDLVESIG